MEGTQSSCSWRTGAVVTCLEEWEHDKHSADEEYEATSQDPARCEDRDRAGQECQQAAQAHNLPDRGAVPDALSSTDEEFIHVARAVVGVHTPSIARLSLVEGSPTGTSTSDRDSVR